MDPPLGGYQNTTMETSSCSEQEIAVVSFLAKSTNWALIIIMILPSDIKHAPQNLSMEWKRMKGMEWNGKSCYGLSASHRASDLDI